MEIITIAKLVNTLGLCFDIAGAWLVAAEVVKQYKGRKYVHFSECTDSSDVTKETEDFKKYERKKYKLMWWGLFLLTLGFIFQILSNWSCLLAIFSFIN